MPKVAKKDLQVGSSAMAEVQPVVESVMVELPMSEELSNSFPIHINVNLSGDEGLALRRIARAYDRQQATLKNGQRVVNPSTAVRKILEQISESAQ